MKTRLACMVLGALLALPAMAKEGDTFRPFVSYTRYYDSNLYRLDKNEPNFQLDENGLLFVEPKRSDHYSVLSAGLNVDWTPGRQRVIAVASKSLVRFSHFDNLDYDGSDYQLKWNWRLGNRWSGQVGATESVTQSNLEYVSVNNQVTRENRFASAEWQFHPRWNVGVGAAAASSTNSTTQQQELDYEDTSASATLGYTTPKGSKLRGQFRRVNGEYPNRDDLNIDKRFTQTEYNLLGDWNLTGKTIVRGRIGYVQRENEIQSDRDFSGLNGRVSMDYFPAGKAMLNWAVYREISNSDELNAYYVLRTGGTLGAAWLVTNKITLRANATLEKRNFEGETIFVGTQREEDAQSATLSLSYVPVKMATIDLGVQTGRRDSNIPVNDYTFRSVFVSLRADF